jgi:hypothetical protein
MHVTHCDLIELIHRKGVLYLRLAQKDLAMESFILSVQAAQYNWSCWLSIAQCIGSTSQVGQILLCSLPSLKENLLFLVRCDQRKPAKRYHVQLFRCACHARPSLGNGYDAANSQRLAKALPDKLPPDRCQGLDIIPYAK